MLVRISRREGCNDVCLQLVIGNKTPLSRFKSTGQVASTTQSTSNNKSRQGGSRFTHNFTNPYRPNGRLVRPCKDNVQTTEIVQDRSDERKFSS